MYQSVIEKTRGLALRTQAIGAAVARTGGALSFENQQQPQVGAGSDNLLQEQQEVTDHQRQVQTVAVG